ncbi:MAG TPA: hypothetical protein VGX21_07710, partial [Methylomirabilota bacterium]|nr:hypothetical protein [Methylomirabilota bacterium]
MRKPSRARACPVALAALIFAVLVPGAAGAQAGRLRLSSTAPPSDGTVGRAAALAMRQGYLVPDQAAYARAKAEAAGRTGQGAEAEATRGPLASVPIRGDERLIPRSILNFDGIFDGTRAPPDSTSAVGSTRYIELVNSRFATYNKTTHLPIGTGTLNQLANASGQAFDPQIIWDATTN